MIQNTLFSVAATAPSHLGFFYSIRDVFFSGLKKVFANKDSYLQRPGADFSRSPSSSFEDTFCSTFGFSKDSLLSTLGISSFAGIDLPSSSSAFSKSRSKIRSAAFKDLFFEFNSSEDSLELFHGYRLLSVDGVELKIHQKSSKKLQNIRARTKKGKTRSFYLANPAFDCINHLYVDVILQPGAEKNEDKAWIQLSERINDKNVIYVVDRGYESQPAFYSLSKAGVKFVCRIKDEESKGAITKSYPLPIDEEYDIDFNVILTNRTNKSDAHPEKYKYISNWKKFGIFEDGVHELPLDLRLIRYKIEDENGTHWFSLMTNLSRDEMETKDIAEIYRLRWQCELSYRDLKYHGNLEYLHSRTENNIESEIYAKMTLYNLTSRIRNELERDMAKKEEAMKKTGKKRKGRPRKWKQRINFSRCMGIVVNYMFDDSLKDSLEIDREISRSLVPVRPGRVDKRK